MTGQAWRHKNIGQRILWPSGHTIWVGTAGTSLVDARIQKFKSADLATPLADEYFADTFHVGVVWKGVFYYVSRAGSTWVIRDQSGSAVASVSAAYDPSSARIGAFENHFYLFERKSDSPDDDTLIRKISIATGSLISTISLPPEPSYYVVSPHAFDIANGRFIVTGDRYSSSNSVISCYDMDATLLWRLDDMIIGFPGRHASLTERWVLYVDGTAEPYLVVVDPVDGMRTHEITPPGFDDYILTGAATYASAGDDLYISAFVLEPFSPFNNGGIVYHYRYDIDTDDFVFVDMFAERLGGTSEPRGVWVDRAIY